MSFNECVATSISRDPGKPNDFIRRRYDNRTY